MEHEEARGTSRPIKDLIDKVQKDEIDSVNISGVWALNGNFCVSNQYSHENEHPKGSTSFDVDESSQHPRKRLYCRHSPDFYLRTPIRLWHANCFHYASPVREPQTLKLKRVPDPNYSDPACWPLAPYREELREELEREDQKNYPHDWEYAENLNPSSAEGLKRNMAEREKWKREIRDHQTNTDDLRQHRKAPGHSLSNELKKKYADILGQDFSPTGSGTAENRGKRSGGSLGHPSSFDDKQIRALWVLENEAETTIGRAMYLGQLAALRKSADKVAKKILTRTQYRVFVEMFETSNLSTIAAQLGASPQRISAMQVTIVKKIREALGVPEPEVVKYETKTGPEWNPTRLGMYGRTRMGEQDPNNGMELSGDD